MDRTQLNIISILLSGAGLFVVLTGFNVPEVNMTFWDANLFAIKRDAIATTMKWIFTIVALCGLLLRLYVEILGERLRARSPGWECYHYFIFCAVYLLAVVMLSVVLTHFGHVIARSKWEPTIVEGKRHSFEYVRFVAEHDGWAPVHWNIRDAIPTAGSSESDRASDMKEADYDLGQIEKLFLEVESRGDLRQRVERIQPMFDKPRSSGR